jgi:hypothetical protein
MQAINKDKQILMHRLQKKGLRKNIIFGFISSLKNCLLDRPNISLWEINKRLQFLGWNDFELDYHTLQLALMCFETEGLELSYD